MTVEMGRETTQGFSRAAAIISTILKCTLAASALAYLIIYILVALLRMRYPFELEWLEGSLVIHLDRLLAGERYYVRPSLDFVPFFYTPLYFYLSALVAKVVGAGFLPLRLVSFVSSLGCFGVIYLFVRRETGKSFPALLACGLFAATFRISGAWLDIARVDSLFLFFLLTGFYVLRFYQTTRGWILAGVLFSLSFLTKQTAMMIVAPAACYCLYANVRRGLVFVITTGGIIGLSTLILNVIHDGWYVYYVFGIPSGHPILKALLLDFWTSDILAPLSLACAVGILYAALQFSKSSKWDWAFYFFMVGGMVGASWLSRVHEGGFDNVLLTAYAAVAILFGAGIHVILESIQHAAPEKWRFLEIGAYAALLLQFAVLIYNPIPLVPTSEDVQAGNKVVEAIARFEGEVFVPYHSQLPALAGKKTYAHGEALYSIMSSDCEKGRLELIEQLRQARREKKFSAIILDVHQSRQIWARGVRPEDFAGYCFERQPLLSDKKVFWPVTGVKVRPEILMYQCDSGVGGQAH